MAKLTTEQIKRQKALAWLKRVAYENPCMKEVKTCIEVLSAPAQHVSEPYKLNSWISVADRLPSEFGRYLCYVEEQNDLGKSHYQWNCSWNGDAFSDSSLTGRVTHWMPLPAAPAQESE